MRSFEQKLQDIRDKMDEAMIDAIDRVDTVRKDEPEDFELQKYYFETYSTIRIARSVMDRAHG